MTWVIVIYSLFFNYYSGTDYPPFHDLADCQIIANHLYIDNTFLAGNSHYKYICIRKSS